MNTKLLRRIKLTGVPEKTELFEIIDLIKDCELESVSKKNDVILLDFFEYYIFYFAFSELKEKIHTIDKNMKISYEETTEICPQKLLTFQAGGSRSIYFNHIDKSLNISHFRNLAEPFGEIENIKFNEEKRHTQIRFSNFDSSVNFIDFVFQMTSEKYQKSVESSKNTNIFNQTQTEQQISQFKKILSGSELKFGFHRYKTTNKMFLCNRTLYLGNIQQDVKPSDILKHVHSGSIYTIRFLRDRKCAFLTFLNPHAAEAFIERYNKTPMMIGKNRIKITYGNNSLIPLPAILSLYRSGASRSFEVDDNQSDVNFENLEYRSVSNNKVRYSFFSMNSAYHAMDLLKQTYSEKQLRYVPDDSESIPTSEYISYLIYSEQK